MTRVAAALGLVLLVGGCCTALRERMDAYARTSAENADTTSILVERCHDGDAEACDGAMRALEDQRVAAETLGGGLEAEP